MSLPPKTHRLLALGVLSVCAAPAIAQDVASFTLEDFGLDTQNADDFGFTPPEGLVVIEEEITAVINECEGVQVENPGFGFGAQDFNLGCADQTILNNKGLSASAYEVTAVVNDPPIALPVANLRALDKLTGRVTNLSVQAGMQQAFETLSIGVQACYRNPETETPESGAFLQITDSLSGSQAQVFSGWMYASSPSLSALEHPIYDVWVVSCGN